MEYTMNTALILIDIQNDYFPGGKGQLVGSLEACQQARQLLDYFRRTDQQRIFIQHVRTRPGKTTFLPGTHGVEIHDNIRPQESETVIQKHYPNSFRDTRLLEELNAADTQRLLICGMMTHMCVEATTRAAYDFGFECLVASDACATRDLTFGGQTILAVSVHGAYLAGLQGTYAQVLPVAELIQLMESQ
jgi:nicotinamidase-related amidase